jgi:hypothetical protein
MRKKTLVCPGIRHEERAKLCQTLCFTVQTAALRWNRKKTRRNKAPALITLILDYVDY